MCPPNRNRLQLLTMLLNIINRLLKPLKTMPFEKIVPTWPNGEHEGEDDCDHDRSIDCLLISIVHARHGRIISLGTWCRDLVYPTPTFAVAHGGMLVTLWHYLLPDKASLNLEPTQQMRGTIKLAVSQPNSSAYLSQVSTTIISRCRI